ncbi:FAD-binding oxidoreductase [Amycolatopsis sp. GM8]|uniref:NAD(P)/FAD-dependent oxidoreductase n=1 Tax=Amycolatopsis sp. GM8 TaxID=2896530 RepID=UPI001F41CAC6|nr:FAD-binding oxidoreductase [Amycolatopsis sp. GM8]
MPSLGVLADARIIVVGAGAVGSCAAYRLAQAGATVTIVERGYPGGATSGNSFAWLNALGNFPKHYYRLRTNSIRAHRELEQELSGDWLTLNGGLHWVSSTGQSQFELTESLKRLQTWGARVDAYTPDELARSVEPGLSLEKEEVETVFHIRDEGWLQPALMIRSLLHRAAGEYGARVINATVTEMLGGPGEVTGVVLDSGDRLEADVVILAAGPDSPGLASLAGAVLPVETNFGILAVTAPAPAMIQHVVIAPDLFIRPDGGGRILATSDSLLSVPADMVPSAELPEIKKLRDRLSELVPGLYDVPFEAFRRGVRALPEDGYPIVGFDPGVNGLYYAVMHSGITLGAGMADLIVDDLSDPDFDGLAHYRPDRFTPGRTFQGPAGE